MSNDKQNQKPSQPTPKPAEKEVVVVTGDGKRVSGSTLEGVLRKIFRE